MDNFYTDPDLFNDLFAIGVYACGTIRNNRRGFPDAIKIPKRDERRTERGTYAWRQNAELLAMSWFDKRPVYFISTIHMPYSDMESKALLNVVRHQPDGTEIRVPCPPAVVDYQVHMRAVDHGDQMMSLINAAHKSRKAWKKLFCYGLEVAKFNSYLVENHFQTHARAGKHDRNYLEFTLELCHGLIKEQSFR